MLEPRVRPFFVWHETARGADFSRLLLKSFGRARAVFGVDLAEKAFPLAGNFVLCLHVLSLCI